MINNIIDNPSELNRKEQALTRKMGDILGKPGSALISVSFYSSGTGRKNSGSFLHVKNNCAIIPSPLNDYQFLGVHEWLCLTIRRPKTRPNLLTISKNLPIIPPFGPVTWLGVVKTSCVGKNKSIKAYLSPRVWEMERSAFTGKIVTKGIIHTIKSGKGGFEYQILEVPAIRRNRIIPEYLCNLE